MGWAGLCVELGCVGNVFSCSALAAIYAALLRVELGPACVVIVLDCVWSQHDSEDQIDCLAFKQTVCDKLPLPSQQTVLYKRRAACPRQRRVCVRGIDPSLRCNAPGGRNCVWRPESSNHPSRQCA